MATVIHSVKLVKEPVLLSRGARQGAGPAGVTFAIRAARGEDHAASAPAVAAAAIAQPAAPRISYEEYEREYKQRLAVELEALRLEAREKGWHEGREAGLAKAMSEHAAQLKALAAVVRAARERLDAGVEDLTDLGVEIAFEVVCKVLGQAFTERDAIVLAVREAVRRARDRSRLVVRVSPADFELIHGQRDRILEGLEAGQVEFAADERVELGGCLLETPSGTLDGRLEAQLANLQRTLLAAKSLRREAHSAK